ncbi:restriction endonuclease subunit S, partial [Candidatus Parcubacteria bacterium]|nr:restriction endonuclease subunit S [Candidatus Parcubacteria bacterium]
AKRHSRFAIASNKTEVLFCEWMVHHINFNGRIGVIVPEGIISDAKKGHKEIRKLFLDNGLWCVVSLPSGVFQPYSGVKTYIIFLDKTLEPEQILFYDIENHGFSLNANPVPIDKNDLLNALNVIKQYRGNLQNNRQTIIDEEKNYTILKNDILENNSLTFLGGKYRNTDTKKHEKWPMVALGYVLDYEQPTKYIVSSENYDDKFKTPVLTAGKTFILGYTNEMEGVYRKELPVIIFDDFTTATKLVDFNFKVKSSAMKILHAKKEKAHIKFLFYMMQEINFQSDTHKRYWISEYSKIKIPLPPLEIQEQVVLELENYQKVIDGARAVSKNWKPSFEINPKWEVVKLEDVFETITPPQKIQTNKYKQVGKYPVIDQSQDDIAGWSDDESALAKSNKPLVIFGDHTCAIKYSEVPFVQGADGIKILETKNNCLPKFLFYTLKMLPIGTEGYKRHFGKLKLANISLPPLEIQKRIVAEIEEEQKIIEANKKLIDLFQQKIEAKIKSIYG